MIIFFLLQYNHVTLHTLIDNGILQDMSGDEQWWSHNFEPRQVSTWQGLTFETVCLMHADCIKWALGISGIATELSSEGTMSQLFE